MRSPRCATAQKEAKVVQVFREVTTYFNNFRLPSKLSCEQLIGSSLLVMRGGRRHRPPLASFVWFLAVIEIVSGSGFDRRRSCWSVRQWTSGGDVIIIQRYTHTPHRSVRLNTKEQTRRFSQIFFSGLGVVIILPSADVFYLFIYLFYLFICSASHGESLNSGINIKRAVWPSDGTVKEQELCKPPSCGLTRLRVSPLDLSLR